MALKRPHDMMATFSMASMTDVIFLLLIFFMVTSTFVFPTALEVNLPQSARQTAIKPGIRIYIDKDEAVYASLDGEEPAPVEISRLADWLTVNLSLMSRQNEGADVAVALYADETVSYGRIVEVLNIGASQNIRIVLATKPVSITPVDAEGTAARELI